MRSPGPFLYAATEAAELDEPGAAAALMALKFSGNSQFRDEVGGYELARIAARKGDDVAAVRVLEYDTMLARSGASPEELERIRSELARLTGKDIAQAFTLQGKLLRTGGILPQDDVAATRVIIRGAELGDVEAMLLAAKAYDDGLGVPKDVRQQVRWLREAAKRGSVEARRGLIWQSSFDSARQITLRESVTERVALYNEQLGNVSTTDFIGGFSGMRMREYTPRRIATAMMDGFRLAPAGLADERLVPLMRQMPQELRAEIEKVLKEEGFYPSGTEGYFGPEARAALGAWADAKGPLTDETPSSGAPQQQQSAALGQPSAPGGAKPADAMPSVPADVLEAYWTRTRETFKAAKTDAQKREVVRMLALLARAGDMSARWLIVRDYDDSRLIRAAVTPVEAVRWGIDVLLTKPPFAEKASIEFAFLAANLGMSRQMAAFGEAFMIAARDDPRLAEDGMLAGLTHDMIFVGGACESIGNQLRKLKAPAYDGRDECGPSMREAIQAVVKAQGPAGVERAARMAAVKELTQPEEAKAQPRKRR